MPNKTFAAERKKPRPLKSDVGRDTKSRFYMLLQLVMKTATTRRVPAGILGRHVTVALTTGCEALLTMYRIGRKSRGGLPSGNPARLRARMGQYGESRQRTLRAVRLNGPTGVNRSMTRFSVFTRVGEVAGD